jgi:hypothetical protein
MDPEALRGLKAVYVVAASYVSTDAQECSVSESSLKTAAEFVVEQSQLKLTDPNAAQAVLSVTAAGSPVRDAAGKLEVCNIIVLVSVGTVIRGVTAWGTRVRSAEIWRQYTQVSAPPATVTAKTVDAVTDFAKALVVDWGKLN